MVNVRLRDSIEQSNQSQIENSLDKLADIISGQFRNITQIDAEMTQSISIVKNLTDSKDYQSVLINEQLDSFRLTNFLIADIFLVQNSTGAVFTSVFLAEQNGDTITLYINDETFYIDVNELRNFSHGNEFYTIESEKTTYHFYVPTQTSSQYFTMFMINMSELNSILDSVSVQNISELLMTDNKGNTLNHVPSVNDTVDNTDYSKHSVKLSFPDVTITAISDEQMTYELLQEDMREPTVIMWVIFVLGALATIVYLLTSYVPLSKFITDMSMLGGKVDVNEPISIRRARKSIVDMNKRNKRLMQSVENFRANMHKSLLGTITTEQNSKSVDIEKIYGLFQLQIEIDIFCVYISVRENSDVNIVTQANTLLSKAHSVMALEQDEDYTVLLIVVPKALNWSRDMLLNILSPLTSFVDCRMYCSDSSDSPMDIARLYEQSFTKFIQNSVQHNEQITSTKTEVTPLTVDALVEYIGENYCNASFSISKLSEKFNVSTSYMSKWITKNLNIHFQTYLWNLRMEKVEQLMSDITIPTNNISKLVGYDNYSSFRRKFKDETGVSPSEYRKNKYGI